MKSKLTTKDTKSTENAEEYRQGVVEKKGRNAEENRGAKESGERPGCLGRESFLAGDARGERG